MYIHMREDKVRVGVIGASGYAGSELLRILTRHRGVHVSYVAGTREETSPLTETTPFLVGYDQVRIEEYHPAQVAERCDTVFVALPAGVSGRVAFELWTQGKRVIDLSGDLRLPQPEYELWYGKSAVVADPADIGAVYGLTEWNRDAIKAARLIANPGCYATAALLALLPAVKAGYCQPNAPIVIDAKSGVSGAGRKPLPHTTLAELHENFYAYKVGVHQHTPEIQSQLGGAGPILLTTQLLPCVRGIFVSAYLPLAKPCQTDEIISLYNERYANEPFVTVHPPGQYPQLKHVRGSNRCHIGLHVHRDTNVLQVLSVIDNLQKGAAGQAVQNFNLMHGFSETEGLDAVPLYP
jgi:N-acetyl-gamma-glutamyl-phosphate reductase